MSGVGAPRSSGIAGVGAPRSSGIAFGFGKDRRIRRRADFERIQRGGARGVTVPHFIFLVAAGPVPSAPSRLGLVVTRKIGGAVQRNRVKRLCRECFRLWPGFVPDGIDLIVIARGGAPALSLGEVRAEWDGARKTVLERAKAALARPPSEPHVSARST